MNGAHHSRELVSIQMPLFSLLKMLHGLEHKDEKYLQMLAQNKYYIIPIVNVDGVNDIEQSFLKTGKIVPRRKNMNPTRGENCKGETRGVDLNRNYSVNWEKPEGRSNDPCAENYGGPHAFSEPETRAVRDFLLEHKDEIKFVQNFHSFGNFYMWPYAG
jgi:carboxypeptidase T